MSWNKAGVPPPSGRSSAGKALIFAATTRPRLAMDSTTTEKYHSVSEWLKTSFSAGGAGSQSAVPDFEINKETVDLLFQLSIISKRRTQESEIITEDTLLKSNEYKLEGMPMNERKMKHALLSIYFGVPRYPNACSFFPLS
jgi:hypothetical protein